MASYLVTGCASGIGRRLVHGLAGRGHRVFATDVNGPGLERAAREDGWAPGAVSTGQLDVTSPEQWERVWAQATAAVGPLDGLLNVAGVLRPAHAHEVEVADVHRHLDINVKGVIFGATVAARDFVARRAGHIITIGSLASMAPSPGLTLYVASKYAVRGYMLALASDLKPHGVKATLVMPDAVDTPMYQLQRDYPQAALTFSGPRPLTVAEVERAILDTVIPRAPLELALPATRGFLARLATFWPSAMLLTLPYFRERGLEAQRRGR